MRRRVSPVAMAPRPLRPVMLLPELPGLNSVGRKVRFRLAEPPDRGPKPVGSPSYAELQPGIIIYI